MYTKLIMTKLLTRITNVIIKRNYFHTHRKVIQIQILYLGTTHLKQKKINKIITLKKIHLFKLKNNKIAIKG